MSPLSQAGLCTRSRPSGVRATLARMTPSADVFRSSRLLRAGRICIALWVASWIGYAILFAVGARPSLRDSVGVIACVMFGLALLLNIVGDRKAWREIRERAAREDLSAARSRGDSRVTGVHN
jgi:hypothetical protein